VRISPRRIMSMMAAHGVVGPGGPGPPVPVRGEPCMSIPLTDNQRAAVISLASQLKTGGVFSMVHAETGAGKTHVAVPLLSMAASMRTPAAIMAPTRLLCLQHKEKIESYLPDVLVGLWTSDRKEEGAIVIGTQALASYPRRFSLLIVDEEQRFGAEIKAEVGRRAGNVIYLTATPIPRTTVHAPIDLELVEGYHLHRLKPLVKTGRFRWRVARRMILRELERGGQVIFVHHPISDLRNISDKLGGIDSARPVVLHGKMHPTEIRKVAGAFRSGEYNVLVATTIVESGIDIPRVNTLITDCAHLFGLGQLHQLLGRVGRHGEQGYAYMGWQGNPEYLAKWRCHACQEDAATVSKWDAEIRGSGIPGRSAQKGRYLERLRPELWE